MTSLKNVNECLIKEAKIGKILSAIMKPKIIRYPVITLGILGAGAAATGIANKVHDLYNISSEMRKRKVMKEQMGILERIAQNTSDEVEESIKEQKPIIHPLT